MLFVFCIYCLNKTLYYIYTLNDTYRTVYEISNIDFTYFGDMLTYQRCTTINDVDNALKFWTKINVLPKWDALKLVFNNYLKYENVTILEEFGPTGGFIHESHEIRFVGTLQ